MRLLSIPDAAFEMRMSANSVRDKIKSGKIKPAYVANKTFIKYDDVEKYRKSVKIKSGDKELEKELEEKIIFYIEKGWRASTKEKQMQTCKLQ